MKRYFLTGILLIAFLGSAYSQCFQGFLDKGKKAFDKGNYNEAKKDFEQGMKCPGISEANKKELELLKNKCDKAKTQNITQSEEKNKMGNNITSQTSSNNIIKELKQADKDYNDEFYEQAFEKYTKYKDHLTGVQARHLGVMYEEGKGIVQDYTEALRWYKKGAYLKDDNSLVCIGYIYVNGLGVSRDYIEAIKWFKRAADMGNAIGMNSIGIIYQYGNGVDIDYSAAMNWYKKANQFGYVGAKYSIGCLYERGDGVSKDISIAVKWYLEAADLGDMDAKKALKRLGH